MSPSPTPDDALLPESSSFRAADFPILTTCHHLNHAAVAPICGPAAEAMVAYARQAATESYHTAGWHHQAHRCRQLAARLIGARGAHEIAMIPNTSTGLAMLAGGLRWHPRDEVVITNVEYPANRYPWEDLVHRHGVRLVEVSQLPNGRIDVEDVLEAITDRTRVVALSHVQYASGHRIDLQTISRVAHQAGAILCVDAIQSVGVLPVDVQAMGIDFLAADGHKWMLGPEGAGFLYCHHELIPQLHPPVVGWMNMVEATRYEDYRFEFQPDARRFEPGTWNIPGICGLTAALELLLEIGIEPIWQRVDALNERLCAGLAQRGYRLFSPRRDPEERSGIVVFSAPDTVRPAAELVKQLGQQGIVIALRAGRLRASPHFYNRPDQIDALLAALPEAGRT